MAGKAKTAKLSRSSEGHPFANKDPKPTRARLVSLLDPLGRKRYGEVERFLATISGATSGLFYYENEWGWAVRYMIGTKTTLCTLHLLPEIFEVTIDLGVEFEVKAYSKELSADLKRRISRAKPVSGTRWVRLPNRSDNDFTNFKDLVRSKADALKTYEAKEKEKAEKAKLTEKAKSTKTSKASKKAKAAGSDAKSPARKKAKAKS